MGNYKKKMRSMKKANAGQRKRHLRSSDATKEEQPGPKRVAGTDEEEDSVFEGDEEAKSVPSDVEEPRTAVMSPAVPVTMDLVDPSSPRPEKLATNWNTNAPKFEPKMMDDKEKMLYKHRVVERVGETRQPNLAAARCHSEPAVVVIERRASTVRRPSTSEETKPRLSAKRAPVLVDLKADLSNDVLAQDGVALVVEVPKDIRERCKLSRYRESLQCLTFFVDPLHRATSPEIMLDVLLAAAIAYRKPLKPEDAEAVETEQLAGLQKTILDYWEWYHVLKYANLGYYNPQSNRDGITEEFLTVDWATELTTLKEFIEKITTSPIPTDSLEAAIEQEKLTSQKILDLIALGEVDELEKLNVVYAATPQIRLQHGLKVSDAEIYELVKESVSSTYGYFLWLCDNKPELLLGSLDIADQVIKTIHTKMLSKDTRPLAALITIVPKMLDSLTSEERDTLAERYVSNPMVKIGNWPEVLFQGYQMRELKNNAKAKMASKCVLQCSLLQMQSVEEVCALLFFCAMLAEMGEGRFNPLFDCSTDSFCMRIGRLFVDNWPEEKKLLLRNGLVALPSPIKARLMAEGEHPIETSLYFSADMIIKHKAASSDAIFHAIKLLGDVVSLTRVVRHSVVPNMTTEWRGRVAVILQEVMKMSKFKEELLAKEGAYLTTADLVKLALEQYAEPDPTAKSQARYAFMKELLLFVDDIVAGDVSQESLDAIGQIINDRQLTWYQHKAILDVCFPKSKLKLCQPEMPKIENTLESMQAVNLTRILQSWPEDDAVKEAFKQLVAAQHGDLDGVVLTYALLNAATGPESKVKAYVDFIAAVAEKEIVATEKETPINSADDDKKKTEWFRSAILEDAACSDAVKKAVLIVAHQTKPYSEFLESAERKEPPPPRRSNSGRKQSERRRNGQPERVGKSRTNESVDRDRAAAARYMDQPTEKFAIPLHITNEIYYRHIGSNEARRELVKKYTFFTTENRPSVHLHTGAMTRRFPADPIMMVINVEHPEKAESLKTEVKRILGL